MHLQLGILYKALIILVLSVLAISCKKDKDEPELVKRSDEQLLRDSIYYYYNLYSLWSDPYIADHDPITTFSDQYVSNDAILTALKGLTPHYAPYNGPIDRFSVLFNLSTAPELGEGAAEDFYKGYGFYCVIGAVDQDLAYPIVYMVHGESPANHVGLRRGDALLELNGESLAIPIDCSSGTCIRKDQNKYSDVLHLLLQGLYNASMQIKIQHANMEVKDFSLNLATYQVDPILADTVFALATGNVGYLALSSFEQIEKGSTNQLNLDKTFADYASQNIKNLIIDLRYNQGGYVESACYVANKIINAAGNDKLMVHYKLNAYLSDPVHAENKLFRDVYFHRNNNLALESIYFIVTDATASAAEMLINVLEPYMDVKIVAENSSTYGKPIGFFEKIIQNKVALWVASFQLENAAGFADYWSGLPADKHNVEDDVFRDFGNSDELMIAAALSHMGTSKHAVNKRSSVRPPYKKIIGRVNTVPQSKLRKLGRDPTW